MVIYFLLILLCITSIESNDVSSTGCQLVPLHDTSDVYVICGGNYIETGNLQTQLENITDIIRIFELQDAVLEVLPPDVFHNVRNPLVQKVIFSNVSMELLNVPELGPPPFKEIEDTVENFEIYNSSTVFAWDFGSLTFENLQSIIIEDSELIAISAPFAFWPKLRFIQLQNSSIKWIHRNAFEKNKKLTICSLAHNLIPMVLRSMFPKPAEYLYSLDLSFNRLQWLPDNLFSHMDALREVKLDNNRLKEVSKKLLAPVWNNLLQFWINGNEIRCSPLCWMAEKTEKPVFLESSKCETHSKWIFTEVFFEQCASKLSTF